MSNVCDSEALVLMPFVIWIGGNSVPDSVLCGFKGMCGFQNDYGILSKLIQDGRLIQNG